MTLAQIEDVALDMELQQLEPFGICAVARRPGIQLAQISTHWMEDLVADHGVLVMRGLAANVTAAELEAFARRMGKLLRWPFGYVLDLKVAENTQNYLFTRDDVQFHWDGVFAEAEPRYLFFQCLQAPVDGGESLYCDTTRTWKRLPPEQQAWLKTCACRYRQPLTAHYGGEVTAAVVRDHYLSGETTIRYAEPVKGIGGNAPELWNADRSAIDEEGTQKLADLMADVLYRPEVCLTHRWQSGDFLLLDNHKLLHGRRAFGKSSDRHLQRVHVL